MKNLTPLDRLLAKELNITTPTREDIDQEQIKSLEKICEYVKKNSLFYKNKLRDFSSFQFKTQKDLENLPRTSAEELKNAPHDFLCTSQDKIEHIITLTSSGSTGTPKRLFFTKEDLLETITFYKYGMQNLLSKNDTALILLPATHPHSVGMLLKQAIELIPATCYIIENPDNILETLSLLDTLKPTCIIGSPTHQLALAKAHTASKKQYTHIKNVLFSWDMPTDDIENYIAKTWNCTTFNHWGMIETVLGGAVSCSFKTGMHMREREFFIEITDPETGLQLTDGTRGEIVLTSLSRYGMPLLRYRTGDEGKILSTLCPCGSVLKMLDKNIVRINNKKDIPSILHPTDIDKILFSFPNIINQTTNYDFSTNTLTISLDLFAKDETITAQIEHIIPKEIKSLLKTKNAPKDVYENLRFSYTINNINGLANIGFAKRQVRIIE